MRSARLQLIAGERITNLYLVPTLYHDLVHHPLFAGTDVSSVRKLGFAGAPMTDALLKKLAGGVSPGAVRQSLWQLRDLHLHDRPERRRQARLGRPRRHQSVDPRGPPRRPFGRRARAPSAKKARSSR